MSLFVRPATAADAGGLAQLKHAVWPDDKPDPTSIARVFTDQDRCTLVAIEDGQMAGFVDAFVTISSDGVTRWEIDLLAVHPQRRGRGIGQMLTRAIVKEGETRGLDRARALTHINNTGVHRTFSACGFTTDRTVYGLYIAAQPLPPAPPAMPEGFHLFSVMTMNYCGLWLEGALSRDAFLRAGVIRAHYRWELAGVVIPQSAQQITEDALDIGYDLVGLYYWWVKPNALTARL